ncbi:nucleotidyltransferase family protein [Paenibacillus aestuarii]|uniref:Nucleotidyltransferase family protein n=1 Tax=Paenibacillus aestuarii TaxID=516965 RepID=A0ABW0KI14_9BACL|nr:nucleotidyltransferase family protein [Paenibacillus aestuarii]
METNIRVAGVYLAAGSSSRMGTAKLSLAAAPGVQLGSLALMQALRSKLEHVLVVTREGDAGAWIPEAAQPYAVSGKCRVVTCKEAASGMAHSLHTGVRLADELGADALLVMLADQPFVTADMLDRLIAAYARERESGMDYIASGDQGLPKPPIVLGRGMWQAVLALRGDVGARGLFSSPQFRGMLLPEENALRFMDVDTPEMYRSMLKMMQHFAECQYK